MPIECCKVMLKTPHNRRGVFLHITPFLNGYLQDPRRNALERLCGVCEYKCPVAGEAAIRVYSHGSGRGKQSGRRRRHD